MTDLFPFEDTIKWCRAKRKGILTPEGRQQFTPSWYAVTECDDGCGRGLTSTGHEIGVRWACKTCFSFAAPIGFEGKERSFPSEDEALDEYGKWRAKQSANSDFAARRRRMRLPL